MSRTLQIERQRQEEAERAGQALDEQEAAQAALKRAEKELRHVAAEQAKEQARLKEISSEKDATLSRKAQVDLDVADLEERREAAAATQVAAGYCCVDCRTGAFGHGFTTTGQHSNGILLEPALGLTALHS